MKYWLRTIKISSLTTWGKGETVWLEYVYKIVEREEIKKKKLRKKKNMKNLLFRKE